MSVGVPGHWKLQHARMKNMKPQLCMKETNVTVYLGCINETYELCTKKTAPRKCLWNFSTKQLQLGSINLKGDTHHIEMGSSSFWNPHWQLSIHRSEFRRIHPTFSHATKRKMRHSLPLKLTSPREESGHLFDKVKKK